MTREWKMRATIALVCWLLPALVLADPIDDLVLRQIESGKIPGIALLVMQNGAIVKQAGYGYASLELRVPVTADTLFQSGSTGKMFTAAGILLLAEDRKLALDDRLSMYFPDAPAAWHRISIRHLLTHTSGLKDYAASRELDYRKDYTDNELLAAMQRLPLEFEPGSQWSYSNSGYVVLGLLITKLTGKHWGEFLTERLFKPLGMQTTQVINERAITPHRAAGYQLDEHGALVNQDWVAPTFDRTGDGALLFSVRDLAAWEKALEARSFMSGQSFTEWWTAARLSNNTRYPYGFGWFLSEQRGEPVVLHTGVWQGFHAAIARYPEQRLAVVCLANETDADAEQIAREVAGLVEHRLELRSPAGGEPVPDQTLSAFLRTVLNAWGNYRVVPGMAPALAATSTGSSREALNRQRIASQMRTARSLRVIGMDRLSKASIDLLSDGTVSAVDTVLETDGTALSLRFRLDRKGRVVSFAKH